MVRIPLLALGFLLAAWLVPGASAHDLTSDWAMYQLTEGRLGAGTNAGPTSPHLAWNASEPTGAIRSEHGSPIIAGETVYMGYQKLVGDASQGWLYAYDLKSGAERWSKRLNNSVSAPVAVRGDTVYAPAFDSHAWLYGLSATDGTQKWRVLADARISNAPLVVGDLVVFVTNRGTMYALDATSGATRWVSGDTNATPNQNAVGYWNGLLYFATFAGPAEVGGSGGCDKPCSNDFVYAIDAADGRIVWRVDPSDPQTTDDDMATTALAVADRVFVAIISVGEAAPARLVALEAMTGHVAWSVAGTTANWLDLAYRDATLYGVTGDGVVRALDPRDGSPRWQTKINDAAVSGVAIGGEVIHVASVNLETQYAQGVPYQSVGAERFLHTLALKDGQEFWRASLPGVGEMTPAVARGYAAVKSVGGSRVHLSVFGTDPGAHGPNAAPVLAGLDPPSGARDVAGATLRWQASDPDAGDALLYEVYFGAASPPPLVSHLQPASEWSPGALEKGRTYHWRVVGLDAHGARAESPVVSFEAKGDSRPDGTTGGTTGERRGFLPGPEAALVVLIGLGMGWRAWAGRPR